MSAMLKQQDGFTMPNPEEEEERTFRLHIDAEIGAHDAATVFHLGGRALESVGIEGSVTVERP